MPPKKAFFERPFGQTLLGIAATLVVSAAGYTVWQTRENQYALKRLEEKHQEVSTSLAAVRQSLLKLSLVNDPKTANILDGLVVDQPTAKGIEAFQRGDVKLAVRTWQEAADRGSSDARMALAAAGALDGLEITGAQLKRKLRWESDLPLPKPEQAPED